MKGAFPERLRLSTRSDHFWRRRRSGPAVGRCPRGRSGDLREDRGSALEPAEIDVVGAVDVGTAAGWPPEARPGARTASPWGLRWRAPFAGTCRGHLGRGCLAIGEPLSALQHERCRVRPRLGAARASEARTKRRPRPVWFVPTASRTTERATRTIVQESWRAETARTHARVPEQRSSPGGEQQPNDHRRAPMLLPCPQPSEK